MSQKPKFYVVWQGREPGVYRSWEECCAQVHGCPGAVYKSFKSEAEAQAAFSSPADDYVQRGRPAVASAEESAETPLPEKKVQTQSAHVPLSANELPPSPPDYRNDTVLSLPMEVRADALAVDAACSGNPGPMEYRGVDLATGQEVFHYGPVHGTNNIGEFLAIVHALALLRQQGRVCTVYSDSHNAMLWVRARKCRTKLERTPKTEKLYQLIARAEAWLQTHTWSDIPLLKWETDRWGEIPADFGRKG